MWPFDKSGGGNSLADGLLPAEVVEALASGREGDLAPRAREVSVFYCEVGDLVSAAQRLKLESFLQLVAGSLGIVEESVRGNHGMASAFLGHTVMALWNVPRACPGHEASACLAAFDVQERLKAFSRKEGLPRPLTARIGISSGRVAVGLVPFGNRRHYTALGDEVNIASQLGGANKFFGTRVLASEATYREARGAIAGRPLGKVRAAGREGPLRVFEPLGRKDGLAGPWKDGLPRFVEGLEAFESGRFSDAAPAFREVLRIVPGDRAATLYAAGAEEYARTPPPPDWDGVWNLTAP